MASEAAHDQTHPAGGPPLATSAASGVGEPAAAGHAACANGADGGAAAAHARPPPGAAGCRARRVGLAEALADRGGAEKAPLGAPGVAKHADGGAAYY